MIKLRFEKGGGWNGRDVLRIIESTEIYKEGESLDYGKLEILARNGVKIIIN